MRYLLATLCLFYTIQSFSQGWVKRIGNDTIAEYGKSVEIVDNFIYIAGYSEQGPLGDADYMFTKMDTLGNIIWTKYFGTTNIEVLSSMKFMHDGTFLLVGEQFISFEQKNIFYLKTDTSGNAIWEKTLSNENTKYTPSHIDMASNHSDFLVAGMINNGSGTGNDMFFARFDTEGNLIFEHIVDEALNDIAMSVHQNTNGEYLLIGDSNSFNGQATGVGMYDYDIVVFKLDTNLNIMWTLVVGDSLSSGCQSSYIDENNNLYVVGETYIVGSFEYDIVFFKANDAGELLWEQKYGGAGRDAAFSLVPNNNNGFLLTGYSNSNNPGSPTDIFLLQTDSLGNGLNWEYFGFENIDISYSIIKENDKIAIGGVSYNGDDAQKIVIYKLKSELINNTINNVHSLENMLTLFPNPTSNSLFINSENCTINSITIFDNLGNKINDSFYSYNTDKKEVTFNNLATGLYFIEVINCDKKTLLKFALY
jgi:hypothetical protein